MKQISKNKNFLLVYIVQGVLLLGVGQASQPPSKQTTETDSHSKSGDVDAEIPSDRKQTNRDAPSVAKEEESEVYKGYDPKQVAERFKESRRWDSATKREYVEKFGTNDGEPIPEGFTFYFFNGQYIDEPYRVSRKGLAIFINDVQVWSLAWPPIQYVENDPPMPKGLTRESTLEELEELAPNGIAWPFQKARWCHSHYPPDIATEKLIEAWKQLPFVASVERGRAEPFGEPTIRVTTHAGKVHEYVINQTADYRRLPEEKVKELLEERRQSYEVVFRNGRFRGNFVLQGLGGFQMFKRNQIVWWNLPDIVDVIKSKQSVPEKLERLRPLLGDYYLMNAGKFENRNELFPLVTNFRGSAQLDQRMKKIRQMRREGDGPFRSLEPERLPEK